MKYVVKTLAQVFGLFVGILATVMMTTWYLDRDGPYERLFGQIVAADPAECGPEASPSIGILPGSCVAVEWHLRIYSSKKCVPVSSTHVNRIITDRNGIHHLEPSERVFGPGKKPFTNVLHRAFILPEFSIPGEDASYHSGACFYCNPYDHLFGREVCKTTPDVYYRVDAR